jgi:pentose-5-phosphate-3-epimerase
MAVHHVEMDPVGAGLEDGIDLVAQPREIRVEIDGGVTPATAPAVVAAGADVLVAGSAVFSGGEAAYARNIAAIRSAAFKAAA